MKYKLSEIFDSPISGEWGTELQEGQQGYKVIRTTNFTNQGRLNLSDIVSRNIDIDKCSKKVLQVGDIIIEKSGGSPNQPVGRVVFFDVTEDEYYFCNNFTAILRPKEFVYPKYGLYLMKMLYIQRKVLKFQNKTTGIINLKLNDYLNQTSINLPSFETQERIANILDQAQELIDKRKAQIEALDELIQSVFYEMFGDPVQNPFSFDQYKIKDLVIDDKYAIKAGPFGSALKKEYYVESGYKVYGQEQVIQGDLAYGDYYIDEDRYRMLENCKIQSGDLLISLVGTFGKMLVVPDNFQEGIINPRLMKISFDQSKILPQFFKSMFQNEAMIKYMNRNTHGATMGILNTTIIKELNVIVPSLEMQLDYLNRRMFIEKQKELLNESLVELENNFNSLMQRAFNGEPLC